MEAALRTAVEKITGETLQQLDFTDVRGVEGIKEAAYKVGDLDVKVAVASSAKNARTLMEKVRAGEADYTFIEIMGCPGGCVNGGGQPRQPGYIRNTVDLAAERAKALYSLDEANTIRKSHENPDIITLYDEFLKEPGSHLAHELLHTTYIPREVHKL
jgi:NADP-reducing hydrogenase subunit HndD